MNSHNYNTLFTKTFLILGFQLIVTWASAVLSIKYFERRYEQQSAEGKGDDEITNYLWSMVQPYLYPILAIDVVLFLALLFVKSSNLSLGVVIFTLWSIITGMEIALVFMSVDETLAGKVLALTASTAFGCAIVGLYSGIDFSFMGGVLFFALLILIAGNTFRLLMNVIEWKHRLLSLCGIFTFIGYLIFDFNKLSKLSTHIRPNTWLTAMDLSISIYLDIINLFLDLLDYISKLI